MHRRTTVILVSAIVIAFAVIVMASTFTPGSRTETHRMPDGRSMQDGEMR